MDSIYHKKYLKYREKYLALKNQIGGTKCDKCGYESPDCPCNFRIPTLPDLPLDIIISGLNLDSLISLALADTGMLEHINRRLSIILTKIMHNNNPQDTKIIQIFLDATKSHPEMITINNLNQFKEILLKIELFGKDGKQVEKEFLPNVVASLSSQEMFDLFAYLVKVFEKALKSDIFELVKISRTINNIMRKMTPHKAICLTKILQHCEKIKYDLDTLRAYIDDIASYDDRQFSQLLIYITNNVIDIRYTSIFMNYRLTDEEIETVVAKFKTTGMFNFTAVDKFIKTLIAERK
jgi:hypothetical protein